jgi:hypothetical protein
VPMRETAERSIILHVTEVEFTRLPKGAQGLEKNTGGRFFS